MEVRLQAGMHAGEQAKGGHMSTVDEHASKHLGLRKPEVVQTKSTAESIYLLRTYAHDIRCKHV